METFIQTKYFNQIEKILDGSEHLIRDISQELFDILSRGLLYPSKLSKEKVLFLGINPSFRDQHDEVYGYNKLIFEREILKTPEKERYSYFRIFSQVSKEIPWTHFDIFPFREKNQNLLTAFMRNGRFKKLSESFALISKKIIEESKPQIIVVSNAYLRRMFISNNNKMNTSDDIILFRTQFSNRLGTHIIQDGVLENTPILFTSMLSGQRALDIGSRERLEWHIRMLYENKSFHIR